MTSLRSRRPMTSATVGAARPAKMAVSVTAWPAAPSLTPMSRASGESRPIGSSSLLTSEKLPKPSDGTENQVAADHERFARLASDMVNLQRVRVCYSRTHLDFRSRATGVTSVTGFGRRQIECAQTTHVIDLLRVVV